MNILWVTPDVPFNQQYGGNFDIPARMQFAAQMGSKIHLICFTKEPVSEQAQQKLRRCCASINILQRPRNYLQLLHPKRPYSASTRNSKTLPDIVSSIIQHSEIDVVCLESVHVGEIVPLLKSADVPLIVRLHNIESLYFRELGRAYKKPSLKLIYMWEANKLAKYEECIYTESQGILCVSCAESELLARSYPGLYVAWLPAAIKLETSANDRHDSGPIIAFSGSMYLPNNIEAVEWFAYKVFPKVLRSVPNAEFWIIGRRPARAVQKLGNLQNIRVIGEVPNTHHLLLEARVVVAPLFHGAGVKIKVLEAIGLGRLVVASSHAINGTTLEDGRHVLVSDDPETFAALCIKALQDPEAFLSIRREAMDYFRRHHQVEVVGRMFLSKLSHFASGKEGEATCQE